MGKKLQSRKFWVAIATTISVWASVLLGVDMSVEQVMAVVSPIVAYLLGQAWVDAKGK